MRRVEGRRSGPYGCPIMSAVRRGIVVAHQLQKESLGLSALPWIARAGCLLTAILVGRPPYWLGFQAISKRCPSGSVKYPEYTPNGRMCAGAVSVAPAAWAWVSSWSTSSRDSAGMPRLNSVELGGPAG